MGLTQEQLSEGICEQATICRFERGTQTPSHNRIKALLQRLGLPGDRYFALLSQNEEQLNTLQNNIRVCEIHFQLAKEKERHKIRAQIWKKLTELESIMDSDDQITRQYILRTKAAVDRLDVPYSPTERLGMLMDAIRLTVPRFELEEINRFRFSKDELIIINQIAQLYLEIEPNRKAIDIYRQLFKYVEKNNQELPKYVESFCLISSDYAIALGTEKRYEEAIEIAEQGWHACIEYGHYLFLPTLLTTLAECHYFNGNKEKSAELYCQAYYLFKSTNDETHLSILKKETKEYLDLEFPY